MTLALVEESASRARKCTQATLTCSGLRHVCWVRNVSSRSTSQKIRDFVNLRLASLSQTSEHHTRVSTHFRVMWSCHDSANAYLEFW